MSNRYYAFLAGEVSGPYAAEDLKVFLQPDLQVCLEGSDAWTRAADVIELAAMMVAPESVALPPVGVPSPLVAGPGLAPAPAPRPGGAPAAAETPPKDLPPKLREFWVICRNATDELLKAQKTSFWKDYFKNEKEILEAELKRRGIG
jgi:hypothetical protein